MRFKTRAYIFVDQACNCLSSLAKCIFATYCRECTTQRNSNPYAYKATTYLLLERPMRTVCTLISIFPGNVSRLTLPAMGTRSWCGFMAADTGLDSLKMRPTSSSSQRARSSAWAVGRNQVCLFWSPSLIACLVKVVWVAINYRLNVFGFLGAKELRARDVAEGSTGNYGPQPTQPCPSFTYIFFLCVNALCMQTRGLFRVARPALRSAVGAREHRVVRGQPQPSHHRRMLGGCASAQPALTFSPPSPTSSSPSSS